ncbi:3-hydroxyacyl-[acyl-carrier-protein] dehydratase FERN, mitochondrial [Typha angustifolia]|uniref:3-hydroxyacyl-[acyl-carrier-protein] dehydratase FERN, mitochondrial n=1 Tax=Typha angustifolia TaxID=59011 RepID=UPI003C2CF6EE
MRLHRLIRILYPPRSISFCSSSSPPAGKEVKGSTRLLEIGDVLRECRRFSASDVASYSEVTGDRNPVHLDADFSRRVAGFEGGRIVHGMLVASLFPSLIASHFPGAIYVAQNLKFKLPVYVGEEVVAEVKAIYTKGIKNRFIAKFTTKCFTNQDCLVIDGEATTILPTLVLNK